MVTDDMNEGRLMALRIPSYGDVQLSWRARVTEVSRFPDARHDVLR